MLLRMIFCIRTWLPPSGNQEIVVSFPSQTSQPLEQRNNLAGAEDNAEDGRFQEEGESFSSRG